MTPETKPVVTASPSKSGTCRVFPNTKESIWCGSQPYKGRTFKGTEHKLQLWEDSLLPGGCSSTPGSSDLAVHMHQLAFGHIPRTICLKNLSLLSYNKAFFLGELLRNLDFATAVMSSQANWYFHSSVQMRSLSKWWVSPVKSFVLAVLQIDQAAPESFESFFSVTPAIVTAQGKSDYRSKHSNDSFSLFGFWFLPW